MNVTLIGMAGAGKSYIGRRLANKLAFQFVDFDDALAARYGKDIQEILDEVGEKEYLAREANIIIESTTGKDGLVFSPGGSIVYSPDALGHAKRISKIVYLAAPFETIEERLRKVPPRAIIGLGRKTLRELYDERHPLYEKHAHKIVSTHEKNLDAVLNEIIEFLNASQN